MAVSAVDQDAGTETQPLLLNNHNDHNQNNGTITPRDTDLSDDRSSTTSTTSTAATAVIVVDFDPAGDPDNPLEWPIAFKWGIVALLAMTAFVVTFTCIAVIPLATSIGRDLAPSKSRSKSASVLLVTIWELGEAAGPLLIAPLSEMYGRYPVMTGATLLLCAASVLAATSTSVPQFVFARMLSGVAVAGNVLNPAIVGDVFAPEERGAAMSIVFLAPLVGGAVGPSIAAAVAENHGWRRVMWMCVALASACELLFFTYFRETYKVQILRRRAAERLRKVNAAALEGGDDGCRKAVMTTVVFDADGAGPGCKTAESGWRKLRDSVLRPGRVLFGSGVLMVLSLLGAVVFSYFYVMSTTLPDTLQDVYGLSPVSAGLCFISFTFGSVISVIICNRSLDAIYIHLRDSSKTHPGVGLPEYRLPLSVVGSLAIPFAIAAYGWIIELRLPVPLLLAAVSLIGSTLMLTMIPIMAYVVDAFGLYSASALTGIIVTRCLAGTFLPLTTVPLVEKLGYGWGFTVFAAVSFCLAPISLLIFRYGHYWRQFSQYSREQ
ncbi:major facilitator superfamily domain-containing protein [Bombardia bombarda]|uniref:Major facilitator superfamily domain-containing protein n=1 Tax=Bombardia bombarda TaxID=252184 RepID=A0AA39XP07_9PEZI|nr:major facilitator superfamily domain-containing protein [Bombardia bombarda]